MAVGAIGRQGNHAACHVDRGLGLGFMWIYTKWYGMVWYTLFKSRKHASPNNTQLVSIVGVFVTKEKENNSQASFYLLYAELATVQI